MSTTTAENVRAPSARLLLLEARAAYEFALAPLRLRGLHRRLPAGDGHALIVVPGFGAGDAATAPLRRVLRALNYAAYGWGLGVNLGMRPTIKDSLNARLAELHERHGPVSLIGWSLGGVFVRELARHHPQRVRRVFTLGSPINLRPDANNMMAMFRLVNAGRPVNLDLDGFLRRITPPPVPCTAIYTREDGIVAWPCCLEPETDHTENVEVRGSHMGLPCNPQVIRAIAERLARP
ncbi:esterase/lipase family protein [Sinimarinibacterium thermocellulolyticum]|uniref:Alpha/beta hydrolase n=1 Tax=Sinimarinibacterium thermocellulolyticum TaxID=3170016 RepID=A0ABV2A6Q0_9GAMM